MRILLMPNSYPPILGGLQTVAHALAQHLQHQGHQIRVVTNRYPRTLPAQECVDGISVNRRLFLTPNLHNLRRGRLDLFLASLYFLPSTRLHLVHLFQTFRPEVVNVHFPNAQIPFVLWLRQRFSFRLIVSLHGHEIMRWFENKTTADHSQQTADKLTTILKQADAVTACSRYLLNKAIELEPGVAGKGHVIYNGIDLDRFTETTAFPYPRSYIFAFGRLAHHKGFDMLLTAFAKVSKLNSQIDLILAGDGEEKSALQSQAKGLALNDRFHLFGRASPSEVVKLLNGCEFVVIPSRQESFGITALEAIAAGKPILATRVGGLSEFVQDTANQLVEPTVTDLVQGLKEQLVRRDQLQVMEARNRAYAAKFSQDKMIERYLAVYQADTLAQ